ncbi:hypothetical protein D3C80_996460 [compost metagenome]
MTVFGAGKRLAAHPRNALGRLDLQTLGSAQGQFGGRTVVAHQAHVATGSQRRFDTAGGIADHVSARHGQVVTEDHAIELQLATQDVLQPAAGEAGGLGIDLWINDVGRHDRGQLLAQLGKRHQVIGTDLVEAAFVVGNRDVRIRFSPAVAGEVLAGGSHPGAVHPADECTREQGSALGITFERTGANNGAALVIQVQHRGKAQVQANGQHFGGHDPAALLGQVFGVRVVGNGAHGGQSHESLAQALHAAALLIHRQQQIGANGANRCTQLAHLTRMLDVTGKNDQAAHFGLAQQLAIFSRQPGTGDVHHQRALQASSHRNSLITENPAHTNSPPDAMPGRSAISMGNGFRTRVGMGG